MYKIASLFTGCGGGDLGAEGDFVFNNKYYHKNPVEIVYALDIDQKALNTFSYNFDCNNIQCKDISEVNISDISDHDILIGGFPCQSFSTLNPTKDPFDERANLYKEMIRILKEKQPKVFIAENVKGFMTLHKGKIFRRVCTEFEGAGYNIFFKLINSADYGIPQKRERVFIIGVRNDINQIFEFPEKTTPNDETGNMWVPLSVAVKNLIPEDKKYYFSERAVQGLKNAKNNMKRGLYQDLNEPCLTITSHLAKVSLNSRDPVLLVDPEKELYRRFTPREAARIQSFPETFIFKGSEGDAYRQIGNAIPPVISWHLIQNIVKLLDYNN